MSVRRSGRGLRLLGLGALATAIALSILGIPVTSAQGTAVFAMKADGPLPVEEPWDPAWTAISPVSVALTGQLVTPPKIATPAFPAVRVRSLTDGERLAVLVEWDDPTMDESTTGVGHFADSAAMQIALGTGTSICMGQLAGGLNIWHWKADWAAAMAGRGSLEATHPGMPTDVHFPAPSDDPSLTTDGFMTAESAGNPRSASTFTSSVEDLSAIGFGTLTTQPADAQNVHGASEYRDGVWRVVMSRDLAGDDPNDARLYPGGPSAVVAFAVWDGARGDRDGLKSVSTWLSLVLPGPENTFFGMWPMLILLVLALVLSGLVLAWGARQPAVGLGWPPGGPSRPTPDADAAAATDSREGPTGDGSG